MTAKEVAELLTVIAEHAPVLRERGLLRVDLGAGVGFTLADAEPAPSPAAAAAPDGEAPHDALEDPETFGLRGPEAPRRMPRRMRTPLLEPGS